MGNSLAVSLLFLLSGFVGVLTEQIFERLLSVVVGSATPAASVVLSIYFLGLGLGGYVASRWLGRTRKHPVWLYGLAESGVALCCLFVLGAFELLRPIFAAILVAAEGGSFRIMLARAGVAAIVVLPAAFAMGLSFPFLSNFAHAIVPKAGPFLARLYTFNLFGAALAAVAAPYALFPLIGLSGSLVVCLTVDAVVAACALYYSRRLPAVPLTQVEPRVHSASATGQYPLLVVAFVSGCVFFVLEVVWTHLTAAVINSSVYAFSSMLFFVTLGLGLGAHAMERFLQRSTSEPNIGRLFLAVAMALLVQTLIWPSIPVSLLVFGRGIHDFMQGELLRWTHLGFQLLPITFFYGMIYPALFSDRRIQSSGAGRMVGLMGALNSLGCVLGALLANFVLLPAFGSELTLRGMIPVLAACGLMLFAAERKFRAMRFSLVPATVLVAVAVLMPGWDKLKLTSGANVYLSPHYVSSGTRLLSFHEDAYGGITTVVDNSAVLKRPVKVLLTNGKFQGDDGDQTYAQNGFAVIPSLFAVHRNKAMVIGLGTGQTMGALHALGFRELHAAEIAPGIVQAARRDFSRINRGVLELPSTRLFLEDGRNVLLTRTDRYDLITLEITSIWFAGASNVYSREFYELAKSRLAEGGVLQQWVQLHHMSSESLETIVGTVRAVFPWTTLWFFGKQGMIVAAPSPRIAGAANVSAARDYLRLVHHGDEAKAGEQLDSILNSRLLDCHEVDRMWARKPLINHDWNRWLEFSTPRQNLSSIDWLNVNLTHLGQYRR